MGAPTRVKVICRLRPTLPHEPSDQLIELSPTTATLSSSTKTHSFPFAACYPPSASQASLYSSEVAPHVQLVLSGRNATVFCYGASGSGKTHTCTGNADDPGLIPRAVRDLFSKAEQGDEIEISVSYLEIWRDMCVDLLVERAKADKVDDLPIREGADGKPLVARLTQVTLASLEAFDALYAAASSRRSTASTKLNDASSRSHAILTLFVRGDEKEGKLSLIDLAGSENNRKTGNDGERMKESAEINKSLSALRKVVRALNEGDKHVPYRDSKLTRLMSGVLGGDAAGLLVCNVAPGEAFYQETLETLTFGAGTRNVTNNVVPYGRRISSSPRKALRSPRKLPGYLSPRKAMRAIAARVPFLSGPSTSAVAVNPRPPTASTSSRASFPPAAPSAIFARRASNASATFPLPRPSRPIRTSLALVDPSSTLFPRRASNTPLAALAPPPAQPIRIPRTSLVAPSASGSTLPPVRRISVATGVPAPSHAFLRRASTIAPRASDPLLLEMQAKIAQLEQLIHDGAASDKSKGRQSDADENRELRARVEMLERMVGEKTEEQVTERREQDQPAPVLSSVAALAPTPAQPPVDRLKLFHARLESARKLERLGDRTSLWAALAKYSLAQKMQRSDAVCARMSVIQEALDGRHSIAFVEKRRSTTRKASISVCRPPPRGHAVLGDASNLKVSRKSKSKVNKMNEDGDASFKTTSPTSDADELSVEHREQLKELVLELSNRGNVSELKKELKGVGDARAHAISEKIKEGGRIKNLRESDLSKKAIRKLLKDNVHLLAG